MSTCWASEAWIAAMGRKGSGATTVLRAYGVLSGILASAVKGKTACRQPGQGRGESAAEDQQAPRVPVR